MDPESGSLGPLFFVPDPYPPKAIRTADVATISNMSKNSFIISVIICFGCKLCSSHARSWLTVDLIAQIVAFFDPDRHAGGQRQALTLMMATINPPMLLLLDEHTAALDPGAAEKILSLTTSIVEENGLTCLMVTHNMQSALELGSRTIMMDACRVVMDVSGAERELLEVADLLLRFKEISGKALNNDRMLLI